MENKSIKFDLNIYDAADDRQICTILNRIVKQIKLGRLYGADYTPDHPCYCWGIDTTTGPEAATQTLTTHAKKPEPVNR